MSQAFQAGDFLIFQIESGYGLLKLLAIDGDSGARIWHLRAFNELYADIESAELGLQDPSALTVAIEHAALTDRAFEATQTSRLTAGDLSPDEIEIVEGWRREMISPSDRSIRLLLGLR